MCLGVLGGQVPRLYGGTIFEGGASHSRGSNRTSKVKVLFFDTFATAQRVLSIH